MSIIKRKAGSEDIVKSVLEFDAVPTEGSPNLLESGAVAKAIGNLGYKLEKVSNDVSGPTETDVANYSKTVGNRLSWYYAPNALPFSFYLRKNTFEFNKFNVYYADSTGVNSLVIYKQNVQFGEIVTIESYPEGYDEIYIFLADYTTQSGIDIDLVRLNIDSVNYRLEELRGEVEKDRPFVGKKIACFGDSITQFVTNGKGYPYWLAEKSGAVVVNGGIGGTRYSLRSEPTATPSSVAEAYAALDISNLVHSWCTNDWTVVDACAEYLKVHDGRNIYPVIIQSLKDNPVSTIDVVTIMAGTNDFSARANLGTSGSTDKYTVYGAINSIIKDILETNPKIKLFMFSPTVRWYDYSGVSTSNPDKFSDVYLVNGTTLKAFSAAIVGEIEKSHIPVCDMYTTLGWNMWNFGNYFLDTDGTHPYKGFENIANRFYAFLCAMNN